MALFPALAVRRFFGALKQRPQMKLPLSGVGDRGHWINIFDWKPGAWQQDATPINPDRVLSNWAVYACLTLIAGDLGKLRIKLMERGDDGIKRETRSNAFSPVLEKPNGYQTRQKFIEQWIISKLGPSGNTYVLKQRDNRGVVVQMYVLDPYRVTPLISPNGSVFYRLGEDWLATLDREFEAVPASEIIHDRAACLFHPLVGISPIYAIGLAAQQGLTIQNNSEQFFRNRSMPGGIITAPTEITDKQAENIKAQWNARYSGENAGRTAVLGDGLKYEPLRESARDSQLTEQLMLSAKMICSAYHVPPFKIGIETLPAGQKVEDMNRIYYADCLQTLMQGCESLLDEGLGLHELTLRDLCTDFDEVELLKMDTATMVDALSKAVSGCIMAPNEARARLDLPPLIGGDALYLQQQNFSLEALAKRDAQPDPFATAKPPALPAPAEDDDSKDVAMLDDLRFLFESGPLSIRGISDAAI